MKSIWQKKKNSGLNKYSLFLILTLFTPFISSAQDFSGLYERLNPSVVTILTTETVFSDGNATQGGGLGSGVIIDKKGLVMTAAHVVGSAETIMVKTFDGQLVEADVISSVASADVALLKLNSFPKNVVVAEMGDSKTVKTGAQVLVIGSPFGIEHSLSVGYISGKQKRGMMLSGQEMEFLQTDASINTGNSGGPIFDMQGKVIGIVSSILTQSGGFDGIGFAAAINPAREILFENSPFWTGFEGLFISEALSSVFNVPAKGGLLVQRVLSNSIADKAGLKGGWLKANILGSDIWVGGDIILSIDHESCDSPHNFNDIKAHIKEMTGGETINMKVLRSGKIIDIAITFPK